uniref:Uncharacterized protein n=1 Tax=Anguilla anguilla TaxID=7936 RepID=A0A0E9SQM4_ANGAN
MAPGLFIMRHRMGRFCGPLLSFPVLQSSDSNRLFQSRN